MLIKTDLIDVHQNPPYPKNDCVVPLALAFPHAAAVLLMSHRGEARLPRGLQDTAGSAQRDGEKETERKRHISPPTPGRIRYTRGAQQTWESARARARH